MSDVLCSRQPQRRLKIWRKWVFLAFTASFCKKACNDYWIISFYCITNRPLRWNVKIIIWTQPKWSWMCHSSHFNTINESCAEDVSRPRLEYILSWPAPSSNLIPCNFFLWDCVRLRCKHHPRILEELKVWHTIRNFHNQARSIEKSCRIYEFV